MREREKDKERERKRQDRNLDWMKEQCDKPQQWNAKGHLYQWLR